MDTLGAVRAGISLLNTCLHAYRLDSKAVEIESDAVAWDVLMRIERTRFEVWGRTMGFLEEKIGLSLDNTRGSGTSQDLGLVLQHPVRVLVMDILKSVLKTLDDFEGTKRAYRLDQ